MVLKRGDGGSSSSDIGREINTWRVRRFSRTSALVRLSLDVVFTACLFKVTQARVLQLVCFDYRRVAWRLER